MKKADYIYNTDDEFVRIIDMNLGNVSVTNDIENVITQINSERNIKHLRIIYLDSERIWSEVIPKWDKDECVDVNFKSL